MLKPTIFTTWILRPVHFSQPRQLFGLPRCSAGSCTPHLHPICPARSLKMTTTALNFDAITNEDRGLFDSIQSEVLAQLQQTLTASDSVSQFVTYLTSYSPDKLSKAGLRPEDFRWNTWKVFTYAAACIPPDHPAQDALVQILLALQASEAPWKDLPEFSMFMRDEWNESKTRTTSWLLCLRMRCANAKPTCSKALPSRPQTQPKTLPTRCPSTSGSTSTSLSPASSATPSPPSAPSASGSCARASSRAPVTRPGRSRRPAPTRSRASRPSGSSAPGTRCGGTRCSGSGPRRRPRRGARISAAT